MFAAERTARQANLPEILERSQLRRTGPIGLMEALVLGSDLRSNTQAKLMGKSLSVTQWLAPEEREVLFLLAGPREWSELVELAGKLDLDEQAVFGAVVSLLRRGFIFLA